MYDSTRLILVVISLIFCAFPVMSQNIYEFKESSNWKFFDVITAADPTSYKYVEFVAVKKAKMFDKFVNRATDNINNINGAWINPDSYIYKLSYNDSIESEIRIRKKDFSRQEADQIAIKYGRKMGQLPASLRKGVKFINILKSDALFGGNNREKSIEITIGKTSELYENMGNLEETLFHEAAHAALDHLFGNNDWIYSTRKDNKFISRYASEYPSREDIAESFLAFLGVYYRRSRIPEGDVHRIMKSIPSRLNFFDNLNIDIYPIKLINGPYNSDIKVSSDKYYRLTTKFLGKSKSLDIINDASKNKLIMVKSGKFSGQFWKIEYSNYSNHKCYRLTTKFLGKSKSLDIINDASKNKLIMAKSGNYSGQCWKIKSIGSIDNGYYRLTTEFLGKEKSLDIVNDISRNKVTMAKSGNYTGQYWMISEIK